MEKMEKIPAGAGRKQKNRPKAPLLQAGFSYIICAEPFFRSPDVFRPVLPLFAVRNRSSALLMSSGRIFPLFAVRNLSSALLMSSGRIFPYLLFGTVLPPFRKHLGIPDAGCPDIRKIIEPV